MKMKKLIAVLLTCVLLCAAAIPALGESGYELLKGYLTATDNELCHLGTPMTQTRDEADDSVFLIYFPDDEMVMLGGVNARGQSELSVWNNVELVNGIAVFLTVCNEWDFMASVCDSGYRLVLDWVLSEDDSLFIEDASDAAMFVETIMEAIQ